MKADPSTPPPQVIALERGSLSAYRIVDVADQIQIDVAEGLERSVSGKRATWSRAGARVFEFATPPLDIEVGRREVTLGETGETLTFDVVARLYEFGSVSVAFHAPFDRGVELGAVARRVSDVVESTELDAAAREIVESLARDLSEAMVRPIAGGPIETYTIAFVEKFRGDVRIAQLSRHPDVAKIVCGEESTRAFSPDQLAEAFSAAHSYFHDDLVVIGYNSAFVVEPSGSRDVLDILELANSQLLELRYYDALLDQDLDRLYVELGEVTGRAGGLARLVRSPYVKLARAATRRLVALSEFTERIDNAVKILGDFYYARVYRSATARLRVQEWRASVGDKQALIMQAYELIKGELDVRRSTVIEITITLLIFVEVLMMLPLPWNK